MSNTNTRMTEHRRGHRRNQIFAVLAAIAVVGGAAVAIAGIASSGSATKTSYVRTGETNAMGMPVIETPGTSSGEATAAGVRATPASFALGRVPLKMAVRPTWTIQNTGADTVTIGDPHAQINLGCCPGAFSLKGSSTLAPGAKADLTFELSMHPGMDGMHDMTVHVPIKHEDGSTATLNLGVTGNFLD